jgi:hypothetical protein
MAWVVIRAAGRAGRPAAPDRDRNFSVRLKNTDRDSVLVHVQPETNRLAVLHTGLTGALKQFARVYADQAEQDYSNCCSAISDGRTPIQDRT